MQSTRIFRNLPAYAYSKADGWSTAFIRLEVKERDRLSKFGLPETLNSVLSMYEVGYHEERERRVEQVFDAMYGTLETDKPAWSCCRIRGGC